MSVVAVVENPFTEAAKATVEADSKLEATVEADSVKADVEAEAVKAPKPKGKVQIYPKLKNNFARGFKIVRNEPTKHESSKDDSEIRNKPKSTVLDSSRRSASVTKHETRTLCETCKKHRNPHKNPVKREMLNKIHFHLCATGLTNWQDARKIGQYFTEKLTEIDNLFSKFEKIEILSLEGVDTSHITSMKGAFSHCPCLKLIKGIEDWDVSNVVDMENMFRDDKSLQIPDLSKWNTSSLREAASMFRGCKLMEKFSGECWKTPALMSTKHMFEESGLIEINLNSWDFSKCGSIEFMFANCRKLKRVDIANKTMTALNGFDGLFANSPILEHCDLSYWHFTMLSDVQTGPFTCLHILPTFKGWNFEYLDSLHKDKLAKLFFGVPRNGLNGKGNLHKFVRYLASLYGDNSAPLIGTVDDEGNNVQKSSVGDEQTQAPMIQANNDEEQTQAPLIEIANEEGNNVQKSPVGDEQSQAPMIQANNNENNNNEEQTHRRLINISSLEEFSNIMNTDDEEGNNVQKQPVPPAGKPTFQRINPRLKFCPSVATETIEHHKPTLGICAQIHIVERAETDPKQTREYQNLKRHYEHRKAQWTQQLKATTDDYEQKLKTAISERDSLSSELEKVKRTNEQWMNKFIELKGANEELRNAIEHHDCQQLQSPRTPRMTTTPTSAEREYMEKLADENKKLLEENKLKQAQIDSYRSQLYSLQMHRENIILRERVKQLCTENERLKVKPVLVPKWNEQNMPPVKPGIKIHKEQHK